MPRPPCAGGEALTCPGAKPTRTLDEAPRYIHVVSFEGGWVNATAVFATAAVVVAVVALDLLVAVQRRRGRSIGWLNRFVVVGHVAIGAVMAVSVVGLLVLVVRAMVHSR